MSGASLTTPSFLWRRKLPRRLSASLLLLSPFSSVLVETLLVAICFLIMAFCFLLTETFSWNEVVWGFQSVYGPKCVVMIGLHKYHCFLFCQWRRRLEPNKYFHTFFWNSTTLVSRPFFLNLFLLFSYYSLSFFFLLTNSRSFKRKKIKFIYMFRSFYWLWFSFVGLYFRFRRIFYCGLILNKSWVYC